MWLQLPDDALVVVAAHLALQCLARARSTCRAWRALVRDDLLRAAFERRFAASRRLVASHDASLLRRLEADVPATVASVTRWEHGPPDADVRVECVLARDGAAFHVASSAVVVVSAYSFGGEPVVETRASVWSAPPAAFDMQTSLTLVVTARGVATRAFHGLPCEHLTYWCDLPPDGELFCWFASHDHYERGELFVELYGVDDLARGLARAERAADQRARLCAPRSCTPSA